MAYMKCKMCGGDLDVKEGELVAECEYCGSRQTIPRLDNDRKANLYERANHFRRINEYDKASRLFEQILSEDTTDAEAYWSLILCKYGIEYVEDPTTHKRMPTVNRVQYTSVSADEDYKSALQYADDEQRKIYEEEAREIDRIRKEILDISSKEEPFDIFICYKETDDKGRRTPDSVLANEMYYQLVQEGYKVFFSRITLEDKLGTAYEPYIFAALNSAQIMIVVGTKAEYFNAVWVKNEWSRFLALIRSGAKKTLIPAYRDMDPYDLPDEFSHLQAQDMSKLGFMQDLVRGIKKIFPKQGEIEIDSSSSTNNSTEDKTISISLKKMFLSLEEKDWKTASDFADKVLDVDPENALAYLGRLMIELEVPTRQDLQSCPDNIDGNINYKRAYRFGDVKLKKELETYNNEISEHLLNADKDKEYQRAIKKMKSAKYEEDYLYAADVFDGLGNYKDATELKQECINSGEQLRKLQIYETAKTYQIQDSAATVQKAIELYQSISGTKDADQRRIDCECRLSQIKVEDEKKRKEEEERQKKREVINAVKRNALIWIGVILQVVAVIMTAAGQNSALVDLTGDIVLIVGVSRHRNARAGRIERIICICVCVMSIALGRIETAVGGNGSVMTLCSYTALIIAVANLVKPSKKALENTQRKEKKEEIYVTVGKPSNELIGMNYVETRRYLTSRGFTSVACVEKKDLIFDISKVNEKTESVSIDNNISFSKNKKFRPDVKVIITYHSFKIERQNVKK